MDFKTLATKINNGEYISKLPYPPYREDKAERSKMADSDRQVREAWRLDEHRLYEIFKSDLRLYIEDELDKKITDNQLDAVFRQAWESGHSSGYHEVLNEASTIVDILKVFLNKEGDKT